MSMNLHLKVDGSNIDLWQTPTYITNMCLVSSKGVENEVAGKKAIRAMNAYLEWVKQTVSGTYNSLEEANEYREVVNEHEKEILDVLNTAKTIRVYQL